MPAWIQFRFKPVTIKIGNVLVKNQKAMDSKCSICLEAGDALFSPHLDGGQHVFHLDCLMKWLRKTQQLGCPYCKRDISDWLCTKKNKNIAHLLPMVSSFGNLELVKALLSVGPTMTDKRLAMEEAIKGGNFKIGKMIAEAGIDYPFENYRLFWLACFYKRRDFIAMFLETFPNLNEGDFYALRYTCEHGLYEEAKGLLEMSDVHALDDYALRYACMNGHIEIVKLLLKNSGNVHVHDDMVLHSEIMDKNENLIKLLLSHGAKAEDQGMLNDLIK